MTVLTNADLVLTPATWTTQKSGLTQTRTGLFNLVGWYGSTHASALWRKAPEFLQVFRTAAIPGFDPQIEGWDPSYTAIEAEVMAMASVVIIRLENNELVNGSLGSIAEVGLALTSAALRGQIIIISIEDNLLVSLTESGAIAQYMLLELHLDQINQIPELARFVHVHRGDDLGELATLACQAAQYQYQTSVAGLNFDDFRAGKAKRSQHHPLRILLGGSGGPYAEAYQDKFRHKQKRLLAPYQGDRYKIKVLSEGATARAWAIPYGSTDQFAVNLAMQSLLAIELEYKQEADVLLLALMAEAASKAAATEIGFLLLHALAAGQEVKIFLEPFDPVDYIRCQLQNIAVNAETDEKAIRQILQKVGVAADILATATQPEIFETFALVKALAQGNLVTFKQIKQSLLGQIEAYQNADSTRRVRTLVQAHLERLHQEAKYPDFFSYATQIES
jgi:hypothetical protein